MASCDLLTPESSYFIHIHEGFCELQFPVFLSLQLNPCSGAGLSYRGDRIQTDFQGNRFFGEKRRLWQRWIARAVKIPLKRGFWRKNDGCGRGELPEPSKLRKSVSVEYLS